MKIHLPLLSISFLALSGCLSYNKPAITQPNQTFTQMREKQEFQLPQDMKKLTLEKAQQLAIENNPDFKSIQFSIDSARAKYYQSYSTYAPTLNVGISMGQSFGKIFSSDYSSTRRTQSEQYSPYLSGQLLIFDCLAREMNILANKYTLKQTEDAVEDAKRLLLRAVAYAYNDVLLAEAQLEIVEAEILYSKKMLEETENKHNAGTALLSDVLNFRILLENGRLSRIKAQYNITSTKFVLAGYLGMVEGTIPDNIELPKAHIPENEYIPSVDIYIDQALINRPDIKAYRNKLKVAEYNYWGSWSSFGPSVTANYYLSLDHSRSINHGGSSNGYNTYGEFGYGITAEWNLFNGLYDLYYMKATLASMAEVDYALAQELINIVTEVRTAYANYKSSIREAKLSKEINKLTLETRDLVDNEYKAGTALVTRVNEAESAVVTAQNNLVTAVINISNARAQLEAAVYSFQDKNDNTNTK